MINLNKKIINYCEQQTIALTDEFAQDVKDGLSYTNKSLPCKYIYDERGSRLFQEIMALPEYYLTNCEEEIMESSREHLCRLLGGDKFYLFELGAGDGKKTKILLNQFHHDRIDFHYLPLDISSTEVEQLIEELDNDFQGMRTTGLISEYSHGLECLSGIETGVKVVLFLGSNIGNMGPEAALRFLRQINESLSPGDYLLIGFDLKKKIRIMENAYNDTAGVTEEFNKNLLHRINNDLGGEFDPGDFFYHSYYDPRQGAIVSFLVSTRKQDVYIRAIDTLVEFREWEPIHTESAFKYTLSLIDQMAAQSGFTVKENFRDQRGYFVDSLWQV